MRKFENFKEKKPANLDEKGEQLPKSEVQV